MSIFALMELLPEAALLSTFPFIFYWFTRPRPPSAGAFTMAEITLLIALICGVLYLSVCAWYTFFWFGSGMSGGGAGPYPSQRLLQYPFEVAPRILVLSGVAVGLALAFKGTLGLWVFAIGAGYASYWAGSGWMPAQFDGRSVLAFAVIAGMCGMVAGFLVSQDRHLLKRGAKGLLWSAVGAGSAALGMLASGPAVQRALSSTPLPLEPIDLTPFAVDPWVMAPPLATAVVVWVSLSVLVAIATGYIKVGRRG